MSQVQPRTRVSPSPRPPATGTARPRGPGPVLAGAARRAWPALALYALVRTVGVLVILPHTDRTVLQLLAGRYDTTWYVLIAEEGYPATCPVQGELCRYAFFPLYPGMIRTVTALTPLSAQWAAWLIAVAASLAAAWGVYAVVERVAGRRAGLVTVVLWGLVPHAVVESMAYTEALFTAIAAWALYAVLTRRWITAGVLAVLAGLTRPPGAAVAATVVLCALWALWSERRPAGPAGQGPRQVARPVAAVVLAPLGWLFWFGWVGYRAGRWDGYLRVQERWGTSFDGGRFTLHRMTQVFTQQTVLLDSVVIAATITMAVVLLVVCHLQRLPAPLLIHATLIVLITVGCAGYFHSKARFLIPAFVLLIPLAKPLARARPAVVCTLLTGAALISNAYGIYLLTVSDHSP
ncbi:glycosyltransferase family 39 protein [Streptomyces sp. NRRL S-118]|uniref:glycosyltransferase family 39 protein n=1 Tax=Streptomyces sp. NRRL S-118 TaxID=1463881 RepID=UPI0004C49159|nr:glycosyltransferase family 39 protein [Streptomyces sp. NRRL S-118]